MTASLGDRDDHPSVELLRRFATGSLSARELHAILDHLEHCEPCASRAFAGEAPIDDFEQKVARLSRRESTFASHDPTAEDTDVARPPSAPLHPARPDTFGPYRLLEELGTGGMGRVYRAEDTRLGREVAVKTIRFSDRATPEENARFLYEARAVASLDHPGIVPIFEIGQVDGTHYFTMSFIRGGTLADRLKVSPLSSRDAAEILQRVAEAVAFAHSRDIVHRDIKPQNILLEDTLHPKLADFGLAKNLLQEHDLTRTGQVVGTPQFMSPEQAAGQGEAVGKSSDVYSLGAVLYACLSGRPPLQAPTPEGTFLLIATSEPVPIQSLCPSTPRDLAVVCHKCLDKDPRKRYASAQSLADDLGRYLRGESIVAKSATPWERAWKWARRRPAAALAVFFLSVIAVGVLGAAMFVRRMELAQWESAERQAIAIEAKNKQLVRANRRLSRLQFAADSKWDLAAIHGVPEEQIADASERRSEHNVFAGYLRSSPTIFPHRDEVVAAASSGDGTWLATGGSDRAVTLWDLRNSQPFVGELKHVNRVMSICFHPDLPWLLTADEEAEVRLWEIPHLHASASEGRRAIRLPSDPKKTWKPYERSPDDPGRSGVLCAALDDPGRRFAVGGHPFGAKVYSLTDLDAPPTSIPTLGESADQGVDALAFSPDGRTLALHCIAGKCVLWDLTADHRIIEFACHSGYPGIPDSTRRDDMGFSRDGQYFACAGPGVDWHLVQLTDGHEVHRISRAGAPSEICGLAFHPAKSEMITAERRGLLQTWDLASRLPTHRVDFVPSRVTALAISPHGDAISTGHDTGEIVLTPLDNSGSEVTFKGDGGVFDVLFTSDGGYVAGVTWSGMCALLATRDRPIASLAVDGGVTAKSSHRSHAIVGVGSRRQVVRVYDAERPQAPLATVDVPFVPEYLDTDSTGGLVVAADSRNWAVWKGAPLRLIGGGEVPERCEIFRVRTSTDSPGLGTIYASQGVFRIESDGTRITKIVSPEAGGPGFDRERIWISDTGHCLAIGNRKRPLDVKIFDLRTHPVVARNLHVEKFGAHSGRFDASDTRLALGGNGGVHVFDLQGKCLGPPMVLTGYVHVGPFVGEERLVVSGDDSVPAIRNIPTGEVVARLPTIGEQIRWSEYDSNRHSVFFATERGDLVEIDLHSGDACGLPRRIGETRAASAMFHDGRYVACRRGDRLEIVDLADGGSEIAPADLAICKTALSLPRDGGARLQRRNWLERVADGKFFWFGPPAEELPEVTVEKNNKAPASRAVANDDARRRDDFRALFGRGALVVVKVGDRRHLVRSLKELPADATEVVSIEFRDAQELRDCECLKPFSQIERLVLVRTGIRVESLDAIASFPQLRDVEIAGHEFGDEVLSRLTPLATKLERLVLQEQPLTDDCVPRLAAMTRLRELRLAGTNLGNEGLPRIAALPNLQRLVLSRTKISGPGLEALSAAPSLEHLELFSTKFAPSELESLSRFPCLRQVGFDGASSFDNACLAQVCMATRIEELGLAQTKVDDDGLVIVATSLEGLRRLNLAGTKVTDAGLANLGRLRHLRHVDVRDTDVTAAGVVDGLGALETLEVLELTRAKFDETDLTAIRAALPRCGIQAR